MIGVARTAAAKARATCFELRYIMVADGSIYADVVCDIVVDARMMKPVWLVATRLEATSTRTKERKKGKKFSTQPVGADLNRYNNHLFVIYLSVL